MRKILICEDEPDAQNFLMKILIKNNYEVYAATDGEESILMAKKITPDVILLDIRMPKRDGLEVAREIRKFNTEAKIIFITAFDSAEISKEATKYDMSDYLVKPVSYKNVLESIEEAFK